MNKPTRTVVSRRARPAKEPLSRELIVKTACELLRTEGVSGMSMRKVAQALDTGASSLYVYVANLQELNRYALDYGLERVELPEAQKEEDWRNDLFEALRSYQHVLYSSAGLAELAMTTVPIGTNAARIMEYILQRLQAGGIHGTAAAWGADLLLLYASSVAFEQASRDRQDAPMQALAASYEALPAARFPLIASLRQELFSGGPDRPDDEAGPKGRFLWGLDAIVQGILRSDPDRRLEKGGPKV